MMAGTEDPSSFDLLIRCPFPLSRNQLFVDFSSAFDRQPHPDVLLEGTIEETWRQRTSAQPSLFSATKFRYAGFQNIVNEGGDKQKILLHLGLTDYKTFIGTNMSKSWRKFLAPSTDDVDRCRHTASPLGNGAIVETLDHHILILQRSINVGEFPGYRVFPGGHSELGVNSQSEKPDEIGIKSHSFKQDTFMKKLNGRIAEEMFDGIIREVVEETGVPASALSDPLFLGISRRKLNVRPTAFFYLTCTLTSAEVLETYRHAEHSFESTVLLSSSPDALLEAGKQMPGCHHGGAALYQLMREALSDTMPLPIYTQT